MLTVERLRDLLEYHSATGEFYWRVFRGGTAGKQKRAGAINGRGYRYIRIDGVLYRAARLAWLHETGAWPFHEIDHKNRDRADDRIANLREARRNQNNANRACRSASGFKGVYRDHTCKTRPWMACITVKKRRMYLGHFSTPEEAHQVYIRAAKKHHGVFAHAG